MTDPFGGGFDPRMFENVPLFRELQKVMAWRGGPVNWDMARQTAAAVTEERERPAITAGEGVGDRDTDELTQAVATAELWLDQVTALPAVDGPVRVLTERDWVAEACTSHGLGTYVEPVAAGMKTSLERGMPEELGQLGGGMGAQMGQAMESLGAFFYGVQVGTVAGHLASQLLGTYDLGVPTLDPRVVGTLGHNAASFARDYAFDQTEFRYWLALRETAHRRQFAGVEWLEDHVAGLIRRFAENADFDPSQLFDQLGGLGMGEGGMPDPNALQEALEGPEAFRVEPTAAQQAVLDQLQALVAFTEGWVATVVTAAGGDKLTALPRIEEAMTRRRATKGPGERFLEQLIGLDLKPGDLRLGRSFCEAVVAARGQEGLDRAWRGPEYLPSQAELAEPSRWLVRMAAAELDEG